MKHFKEPILNLPQPKNIKISEMAEVFPVGRVFCVGKNYAEHIKEMGGDPLLTSPTFFMKTPQSILNENKVPLSGFNENIHYEGELVIYLTKGGKNIKLEDALSKIFGVSAGIDFTKRDLQAQLKKEGKPWEVSKAFDYSAPVGDIKTGVDLKAMMGEEIITKINGQIKQQSRLKMMIWKPAQIIFHLSKYFELLPGDTIFTGTPAGVGEIKKGDEVEVSVGNICRLELKVD